MANDQDIDSTQDLAGDPEEAQGDALIGQLLDAIIEADLAKTLKKGPVAAALIGEIQKETGLPRLVCRLIYHWVLVAVAAYVEKGAKARLAGAGEKARGWLLAAAKNERVQRFLRALNEKIRSFDQLPETTPEQSQSLLRAATAEDFNTTLPDVSFFSEQFQALAERLAWAPPISLDLQKPSETDTEQANLQRFVARYLAIPYQRAGRQSEHQTMEDFLDQDAAFSWAVITGAAGTGKTRFGIETALACQGQWEAGFLGDIPNDSAEWQQWRPVMPTLIIIDYAASRPEVTAQALEGLYRLNEQDRLPANCPVRLLLIERVHPAAGKELEDPQWRAIYSNANRRDRLFQHRFAEPVSLPPPTPQDLKHIIATFTTADPKPILESLGEIKGGDRPLFAAMAAEAVEAGRLTGHWDKKALLRAALDGPRSPWENGSEVGLLTSYLVAFPTMMGKLDAALVRDILNAEPNPFAAAKAEARNLVAATDAQQLLPLEPDLLGEAFVLQFLYWLYENEPKDTFVDIVRNLWAGNEDVAHLLRLHILLQFFVRCAQDFLVDENDAENDTFATALTAVLRHRPVSPASRYVHALACYISVALIGQNAGEFLYFPSPEAIDTPFTQGIKSNAVLGILAKAEAFGACNLHEEEVETYGLLTDYVRPEDPEGLREQATIGLFNRGVTLNEQGRHDEAIDTYARLTDYVRPDDPEDLRKQATMGLLNRGMTLDRQGRPDEAIDTYGLLTDYVRPDDPEDLRKQAAIGLRNRGLILDQQSRPDEAIDTYGRLTDYVRPDDPEDLREPATMGLLNRGLILDQQSRPDEAIDTYGLLTDYVRPDDPEDLRKRAAVGLFSLGMILSQQGRPDEAIDTLGLVTDYVRPDDPEELRKPATMALFGLGLILDQKGRPDEAIDTYGRLPDYVRPDDPEDLRKRAAVGLFCRGCNLVEQSRHDEAIDTYGLVTDYVRPNDPEELRKPAAMGLFNRGVILDQQGRPDEARDMLNTALTHIREDDSEQLREVRDKLLKQLEKDT